MITLSQFFFFYNAAAIIVLSLLVVTRKNAVHSVLFMLALFFHIAGLYLFLNAEFIAALQIVVYAGAILVLFLFVVFLLNLKTEDSSQRYVTNWPTAAVLGIAIFAAIAFSLNSFVQGPLGPYTIEAIKEQSHIKVIGTVLYTRYIFPFELASLILLVAMVGSITLAKKKLK